MNSFLKKVIAQSPDDLHIISAICADSKVKISDIKYLPSTKIFLLSVLRMDKETANGKPINSVMPAITLMLLLERILFFKNSANGLIQTKIPKKTKKKK